MPPSPHRRRVICTPVLGCLLCTLLLTCGLPGSGKTTLARRLAAERDAQRFTKDEWVRDLGGDLWDEELRIRLEGKLIELAFELLAAGRSCILDFGLWSR